MYFFLGGGHLELALLPASVALALQFCQAQHALWGNEYMRRLVVGVLRSRTRVVGGGIPPSLRPACHAVS